MDKFEDAEMEHWGIFLFPFQLSTALVLSRKSLVVLRTVKKYHFLKWFRNT